MKPNQIIYQGKTKTGRSIVVRYPQKGDLNQLREYINALSREKTYITFQGEEISLKEEKKYLTEFMKKMRKGNAVKLLVFSDNQLIGVSDITMKEKIESHIGVFGITIAKSFRNEGIGNLLMDLVIEEAKKNLKSLRIIILGCFSNNTLALKMYQKHGFKEYSILPKGIHYKNGYVDHIYMYKEI